LIESKVGYNEPFVSYLAEYDSYLDRTKRAKIRPKERANKPLDFY